MRIGLVTDSNSDLPADLVERHHVRVIPTTLVIDGQPYRDGVDITRREFYERLPGLRQSPTSAAPAQAEFSACFSGLLAAGCEHILAIFTAEKLTAIANIGRLAAKEFPGQVSVIESGSLSMGSGYQVLAAAEAIERGLPLSEVLARVQSVRERCKVFASLDTFEYLRRSGRMPQAATALGGLLHIKPILELREGALKPVDMPRTTSRANDKMAHLALDLQPIEKLAILHSNTEARVRQFLDLLKSLPGLVLPEDILTVNVTSVIGTHVGPGALGLIVLQARA